MSFHAEGLTGSVWGLQRPLTHFWVRNLPRRRLPHIAGTMATATPKLRLPLKINIRNSTNLHVGVGCKEKEERCHYSQEVTKKNVYSLKKKTALEILDTVFCFGYRDLVH